MLTLPHMRALATAVLIASAASGVLAQDHQGTAAASDLPLFAVEITVGPNWDQSKPAQDQKFFREHSSNLKRLRDAGVLIIGARYSDKGLVLLAAKDDATARALMDEDPAMKAEVFKYQLHPLNVFYGGTVATRPRRPPQ